MYKYINIIIINNYNYKYLYIIHKFAKCLQTLAKCLQTLAKCLQTPAKCLQTLAKCQQTLAKCNNYQKTIYYNNGLLIISISIIYVYYISILLYVPVPSKIHITKVTDMEKKLFSRKFWYILEWGLNMSFWLPVVSENRPFKVWTILEPFFHDFWHVFLTKNIDILIKNRGQILKFQMPITFLVFNHFP